MPTAICSCSYAVLRLDGSHSPDADPQFDQGLRIQLGPLFLQGPYITDVICVRRSDSEVAGRRRICVRGRGPSLQALPPHHGDVRWDS